MYVLDCLIMHVLLCRSRCFISLCQARSMTSRRHSVPSRQHSRSIRRRSNDGGRRNSSCSSCNSHSSSFSSSCDKHCRGAHLLSKLWRSSLLRLGSCNYCQLSEVLQAFAFTLYSAYLSSSADVSWKFPPCNLCMALYIRAILRHMLQCGISRRHQHCYSSVWHSYSCTLQLHKAQGSTKRLQHNSIPCVITYLSPCRHKK